MSLSRRRSVLPVLVGLVVGVAIGNVWSRELSAPVAAQASVGVHDPSKVYFYVERLKTLRQHALTFSHSRSDGACRVFLYTTVDGVSVDLLQRVDVRFCQVLQLSPADAVKRVKP